MTIDLDFAPNGQRAVAIDRSMRELLAHSIEAIAQGAATLDPPVKLDLGATIARLRGPLPTPPVIWALYGDLGRAIATDDVSAIEILGARLQAAADLPCPGRICNLTDEDLGPDGARLYARTVDDDVTLPIALQAVGPATKERVEGLLPSALALVQEASDELFQELEILSSQIVLASADPGQISFSGAATLFLWGAVLLNPDVLASRLQLVEALTHECGHALLTGLTGGIDVTTNDKDAYFRSPLRSDPRPMEGIAHATFVLARINFVLDRIARSSALSPEERDELAEMREHNDRLYGEAENVLRDSARFSTAGHQIFKNCFDAMRARC